MIEKWGIDVHHRFINRQPTPNFTYSLTAHSVGLQSEYSPNYKGLLSVLDLVPVTGGGEYCVVKGKSVTSLPLVKQALSNVNGTIIYEFVHEEEWQTSQWIWKPFIDVDVKSGWFSSEKRRIYL
ncbi:hypothetical protein SCD_n01740 [Sulfuricella denitrificans skB26]|uniref:Uncharacterized protein n=1 Tax=Sulfuricella denitrificans (strain DSM 22764 / NBRC 105220 / skB26) TaxID=1163617 RepID=S6AAB2_SULDS|nr:hypothetical protein SCD_n01740 [Sulfuricella denitrificans skB26]